MVMAAQSDDAFRTTVNRAALVTCDTIGLLLASRLRGGPLRERVTGVELVGDLAARSAQAGDLRVFLMGGAGDTAQRAAAALRARYPGVRIVGARDGYFSTSADAQIAAEVRGSGANVLLAGLGSPKQELWLERWLPASGCGVGIGIGGSLDVFAGNVQRAPAIFQRFGLEWLHRLVSQPSRWRRQLALPRFAFLVVMLSLSKHERSKHDRT